MSTLKEERVHTAVNILALLVLVGFFVMSSVGCAAFTQPRPLLTLSDSHPRVCGDVTKISPHGHVSETFVRALEDAVRYWNEVIGFTFKVVRYDDKSALITVRFKEMDPPSIGKIVYNDYGKSNKCVFDAEIQLSPSLFNKDVWLIESVFRHELGHALGLRHTDTLAPEVMNLKMPSESIWHPLEADQWTEEAARKMRSIPGLQQVSK